MYQFIETLCLKNGFIKNVEYHNQRMNTTISTFFNINKYIDLSKIIKIDDNYKSGIFKIRITYSNKIDNIEFIPYTPKVIHSLKLIFDNQIEYNYKYKDRTKIEKLLLKENNADDILIIKNNKVTDTSIANVVFFDGQKWYTPSQPLLKGTKRQKLIDNKIIYPKDIHYKDIEKYMKISLINAFYDLDELTIYPHNIIK